MIKLFHETSEECSRLVTQRYSTSFASAIRMLHRDLRAPICNIYGFVRLADEIVDSFHEYNKPALLDAFRRETFDAIERGISLNPILNSFQRTVNQYNIDLHLVEAFFRSMEMDLTRQQYDEEGYREYIYGSAEVVGLMCLYVFCEGDRAVYERLKEPARSLGAAFQKVNFLRDIKADYAGLARVYFPRCDFENFTCKDKQQIEDDIQADFRAAYKGITHLPLKARFGVYVAYKYYLSLFRKIRKLEPARILGARVRIPNYYKALIVLRAAVKNQLRLIQPESPVMAH
ncbi:MAG: phytoene/squalene synthase family protein [Chitinophagaceae bacterium]